MGKRGPKPTPRKVLEMRGSRALEKRRDEPQPEVKLMDCPQWVTESGDLAVNLWNKLGTALLRSGIMTELDGLSFAILVNLYVDIVKLRQELEAEGNITDSVRGTPRKNPKQAIYKEYVTLWHRYADSFGLSPAARAGIKVVSPEKFDMDNDDARFFD